MARWRVRRQRALPARSRAPSSFSAWIIQARMRTLSRAISGAMMHVCSECDRDVLSEDEACSGRRGWPWGRAHVGRMSSGQVPPDVDPRTLPPPPFSSLSQAAQSFSAQLITSIAPSSPTTTTTPFELPSSLIRHASDRRRPSRVHGLGHALLLRPRDGSTKVVDLDTRGGKIALPLPSIPALLMTRLDPFLEGRGPPKRRLVRSPWHRRGHVRRDAERRTRSGSRTHLANQG